MANETVFAYTPPGSEYPPFVNLSELNGELVLTMRSPNRSGGQDHTLMDLPEDQALILARSILRHFNQPI